jgi:hypothetical protein
MKFLRSSIVAACVAGCASIPAAGAKDPVPPVNTMAGVQIGVGSCVSLEKKDRIVSAVAFNALVSEGLNLLGNALTEAGNDKTWNAQGARNLSLGSEEPFPNCMQIVRGRFRTDARRAAGDPLKGLSLPEDTLGIFEANGIWLADRPDFVFEGRIVTNIERTAATIRPLYAVMLKPIEDRAFGEGGKERSVVAFFAISKPGQNPTLANNAAATVVLGPMKPGQVLRLPKGPDSNTSKYVGTPYEASWFTMSNADAKGPITVYALVAETQPGNEFAKFLATIFNRPDVRSAITQTITQQD